MDIVSTAIVYPSRSQLCQEACSHGGRIPLYLGSDTDLLSFALVCSQCLILMPQDQYYMFSPSTSRSPSRRRPHA
ncbi:hypothetical protein VTN77DRAFT_8035 [Rasamsonia byssochlamydoides]|uniref:uncharacterized protein n=1 Tax=Rasamsonia byssochlamydoides TaxID=89139 RepID=UPI003742C74D